MGGSLAVTLREPDGTEHRTYRSTNTLPWFITNMRFVNKDPEHVKEYLKTWYERRADYEAHKEDGKFKLPMSDFYAPYPFLAPISYGLVVLDMTSNNVLHYQGYTNFERIYAAGILYDMKKASKVEDPIGMNAFYTDPGHCEATRLREFFDAERIICGLDHEKGVSIVTGDQSLDGLVKLVKLKPHIEFAIDMSPFRFVKYGAQDPDEAQRMREKIRELGFVLSDEENKIWDEWIKKKREP